MSDEPGGEKPEPAPTALIATPERPVVLADSRGIVEMPIDVYGPQVMIMYFVPDQTLKSYEGAVADVSTASGFLFFCAGSGLTLLVALLTTTMTVAVLATFAALVGVAGVLSVWFAIAWYRAATKKAEAKLALRTGGKPTKVSRSIRVLE